MRRGDIKIRDDVVAELEFMPGVHAESIGVAVKDGVVTLVGNVPAYGQMARAEAAVKRIRGVCDVVQNLNVELPYDAMRRDEEIAAHAVDILAWSAAASAERLTVAVEGGWVTLTGEVGSHYEAEQAERAIAGLQGIVGIHNRTTVRPAFERGWTRKQISDAFRRAAHLDARAIEVSINGGEVVLSGSVKDLLEREIAEETAWAAPGVTHVVDHIRITP